MLERQLKHLPRGVETMRMIKVQVVNQTSSYGSKALQYVRLKYLCKPTVCLLFSDTSCYGSSPEHVFGRNHTFLCASPPMTLNLG